MAESKRSAARAKVAREAGGSVRQGGNINLSNDNASRKAYATDRLRRKTERDKRRRDEDRIYAVSDILLEDSDEYKSLRRIWNILMIGAVAMIISTVVLGQVSARVEEGSFKDVVNVLTTATLILGYVLIAATFIFDMIKMRPLRAEYDQRVRSMTDKRQQQILADHEEAEAAKRKAKREAKKAK
ncbi:MAG: hypothetical protein IJH87_04100 [Atopobiaceae bacterium]|nr:hypothetical protein [Atopobiaceae bacterium]